MVWKIVKLVVGIYAILGIFGFGKHLIDLFQQNAVSTPHLFSFALGGIVFCILWMVYFSKRDGFWSILEHELTHGFFALLFFKKVHSMSASRKKGGVITIEGGNTVIALAPYFFPLAATILLIVKFFVESEGQIYLNFGLGFTYLFHLINLFSEFHPGQPDLKNSGYLFSIVLVFFLNVVFLGIILSALPGEWHSVINFLKNGWIQTWHYIDFSFYSGRSIIFRVLL